ncbi:MAG: hypothetical protein QOH21_3636 [Acidobacteriota bacterium]|nr:hypothetical protein [Acidobacteriota bacterium]
MPANLQDLFGQSQFVAAGIDTIGSGYDAVRETNKRRSGAGVLRSEDDVLRQQDRKKLLSSSQLLYRNFALARWMIARHLDYITTFRFKAKTKSRDLDNRLESLVRNWSQPGNFEVTRRFSRAKFVRMAEQQRTLNGDFFALKCRNGMVQALEGERVRTPVGGLPTGYSAADFVHGVRVNKYGESVEYCLCRRGPFSDAGGGTSTFTFERMYPARFIVPLAYIDRPDQVRGISPLACSINPLMDVYESFGYTLSKIKQAQFFGAIFKREVQGDDPLGEAEEESEESEEEAADAGQPKYGKIDWSGGPFQLNLDPGDTLEFVEAATPTTESQAFWLTMIQLTLKALDIPYSFFDESFTNYSGARQALLQYEESAKIKREDLQYFLDNLTRWRVWLWMQDGSFPEGVTLDDLNWEWLANGMPWLDPLKEITADIATMGAGLTSRQRLIRAKYGDDFFDVADELAQETKYMADRGLNTTIAPANVQITEVSGK